MPPTPNVRFHWNPERTRVAVLCRETGRRAFVVRDESSLEWSCYPHGGGAFGLGRSEARALRFAREDVLGLRPHARP